MIYIFKQINRIVIDGITSLLFDLDGNRRSKSQIYLGFIVVPFIICAFVFWKEIHIDGIIDTLLTVLSIFTALIFGVLFTVPDKLSQRIDKYKSRNDIGAKNYLIRFCNFTRCFVQQIAFTIVLCIFIIILLVFQKAISHEDIKLILTGFDAVLFYDLLMYILVILSNIYVLLMDDIDMSKRDLPK